MTAQVVTLAGRTSLGIDGLATLRRENAGRSLGCHGDLADPVVIGGPCVWRVDQPRGSIFVAGDSHALAWSDVLVEVANAAGYDVYVTTRSLCPFQTVPAARRGCAGYQRDVLEAIERIRPTAVLVANRAAVYTDVDETLTGTAEQSARREALDRWESGLDTALSRVEATGARIALVDSVPEFGSDGARTVTVLRPRGRPAHLTIAELEHRRGPTSAIHHRLAAMHPNVVLVDPAKALCADGECAQWRDGTWLYRDDDHVSEAGAWAVLPEIAAALGLSVADGA